jgi:hypothetical protein
MVFSPSAFAHALSFFVPTLSGVDILLRGLLRLIGEAVQDINLISELSQVKHPEDTVQGADPDFPASRSHRGHWFPVIRIAPELQLLELETRVLAGILGK